MENNIIQIIKEINIIFDTKYFNRGFLKGTNHTAETFFYSGACWYYAYMLKQIYPQGEILISTAESHVIFKLNNKYYDVYGEILNLFNKDSFFIDAEIINSPAFIHNEDKTIIELIDFIIMELKEKSIIKNDPNKERNLSKI